MKARPPVGLSDEKAPELAIKSSANVVRSEYLLAAGWPLEERQPALFVGWPPLRSYPRNSKALSLSASRSRGTETSSRWVQTSIRG